MSRDQANAEEAVESASRADRFFDTRHLKQDLKGRSVRGGTITLLAQGAKFALQLASTVCLARLLDPTDFGVVAMVIAVTGFVTMFKDLGLSMATVQREDINHAQVSTLFWVNVGVSIVLFGVTCALAPAIAWFYGEPRLTRIALIVAGAFLFSGLTVQHQALLRRHMRFKALAAVDVSAMALAFAVAIAAALLGMGYWSLVAMHIVIPATTAIGVWLLCAWRPGRPVRGAGVRSMLAFGGNLTGFNIVNYFARNLDRALIGWCWGAAPLGLYSRAYSLLLLPLQQITPPVAAVAVPALSRLQNETARYRNFYLRAVSVVLFVATPLTTLMIVAADETISLLLGPKWTGATDIFRFLAVAALVQPLMNSAGWVYISGGRTRTLFVWGLIASAAICMAFIVGVPYGPNGVAVCYAAVSALLLVPGMHLALKSTTVALRDVAMTVRDVVFASLIAAVVTTGAKWTLCANLHAALALLLMTVIMAVCYLVLVLYAFGRRDEYLDILRELRRKPA